MRDTPMRRVPRGPGAREVTFPVITTNKVGVVRRQRFTSSRYESTMADMDSVTVKIHALLHSLSSLVRLFSTLFFPTAALYYSMIFFKY